MFTIRTDRTSLIFEKIDTAKMRTVLQQIGYYVLLISTLEVAVSMGRKLKWVRINVPQYKIPGESALLECDYDLGNDTLYAVKWYKDHEEFYRFIPKERVHSKWWPVRGIKVNLSKSDNKKVFLENVNWMTSGVYRCEVSAEAPSFSSAQSEARLDVVTFSEENPIIAGVEMAYQIGDEINLNCTSGKSYPASILHWYINEQQIQKPEALVHYPAEEYEEGLLSSTLGLRFVLSDRHFLGGSMRVKCVSSIAPVLLKSNRESITKNLPIQDRREALLLVRSSSSNHFSPFSQLKITFIFLCMLQFFLT